jgi:hypothetical protein
MHVDPTKSSPHQTTTFDKRKNFVVIRDGNDPQRTQEVEQLGSVRQMPARQLPYDEGMYLHLIRVELSGELRVPLSQVLNPNRGIDEHGNYFFVPVLLRGTARSARSVPPRAARRRALSRAMSASKPACTTAVFSRIPVSFWARSSSLSSIIKVVLICTNMHQ